LHIHHILLAEGILQVDCENRKNQQEPENHCRTTIREKIFCKINIKSMEKKIGKLRVGLQIHANLGNLFLSAYLICAESLLHQDFFYPMNMVALQLDQALFYGSAAG